MSNEDRQRALGRALEEFSANKKELAALQQRSQEIGNCLHDVGQYLCSFAKPDPGATKARAALSELISVQDISQLVEEIETAKASQARLRQILAGAGVEPKD
jgi:predicted  nucleic acid-binding Zn-ribbon protein